MNSRPLLALIVTILFWSSAFTGISAALKEQAYSPASLALLRFSFASITLAVCAMFRGIRRPDVRDFPAIVALGLVGVSIYHLLLNRGEMTVQAGTTGVLVNTAPVFMALIAYIKLGERLNLWGWLGSLISLAGIPFIAFGEGQGFQFDANAFLILGAALCASIYYVYQKPFLKKYSAFEFTSYVIWAGTLCLAVFLPKTLKQLSAAPLATTLLVAYLGIFPGALATVTWAYVLARQPASKVGSWLYLIPVFSLLFSWILLNEIPGLIAWAGCVLVLTGVFVVQAKK